MIALQIPSLEELPLHGFPNLEWACEHPERPFKAGVHYDPRCRSCMLHARAVVANDGNVQGTVCGQSTSLAELFEWFDEFIS